MNEPAKNPFEPFFDEIRRIVRDEIKAANNGNGHSLLTAEQLAKALQVNKATVYEWVKSKRFLTIRQAASFGSIWAKFWRVREAAIDIKLSIMHIV